MSRPVSRRGLLLGGAAAAGCTVLLGASEVDGRVGRVARRVLTAAGVLDEPDGAVPDADADVSWEVLDSRARGRRVELGVAVPAGAAGVRGLPICVVLHGRGDSPRVALEGLRLGRFAAAAADRADRPWAVVAVDGGETYWHRRDDGDDPAAMVWDEVVPLLRTRGAVTDRVALWGWSMGGYGALLLAEQRPERVLAVAVSSPAVWRSASQTSAGAFDDAQDWRDHDVFAGAARLRGVPVRLDCGQDDPFAPVTRTLRDELETAGVEVAGGQQPGGHSRGYWRSVAAKQAEWLTRHLTD